MKRLAFFVAIVACLSVLALDSEGAAAGRPAACATIEDGTLKDTYGNPLVLGYDAWGYNYQDHTFMGFWENLERPEKPVTESGQQIYTLIEWNDAWLSNKDCDGDGKLDRHYGSADYQGSGAWLKVYEWGFNEAGPHLWYQVYKVVAVPLNAVLKDRYWYRAGGKKVIGPQMYDGPFAMVEHSYQSYPTDQTGSSGR